MVCEVVISNVIGCGKPNAVVACDVIQNLPKVTYMMGLSNLVGM